MPVGSTGGEEHNIDVVTSDDALRVLGLPATHNGGDVDMEDVKSAYRRLAMKWHPDKNEGSEQSAAVFKRVTGAYHMLTTANFDFARWSANFVIPPLQTLGDVWELAMKGQDVERILRARGDYRPHPEFGVNLHVPWSAGSQEAPSTCPPSSSYTSTRHITSAGQSSHMASGSELVGTSGFVGGSGRGGGLRQTPLVNSSHEEAPRLGEEANERGMAAFKAKCFDKALDFYTEAVMLQPEKAAYRGNRAAAALKLCKNTVAVQEGLEATRLDPNYIKGYVRTGRGLLNLGETSRACQQFRKALDVDPEDKMALKGMRDVEKSIGLE